MPTAHRLYLQNCTPRLTNKTKGILCSFVVLSKRICTLSSMGPPLRGVAKDNAMQAMALWGVEKKNQRVWQFG